MSKEQTPLEELIHELEETIRIHGDDSLNGLLAIERARELLTKEKEQREELIKKTYADALINLTMVKEGKISKEEMEMINKRAEQYYNEVIKSKSIL